MLCFLGRAAYFARSSGYCTSELWFQLLVGDQNRAPFSLSSRNRSAIVVSSSWTENWFQDSKLVPRVPSLVLYDFLHACDASINELVSFSEACWNPSLSQSSLTDGTLLSATVGFLEVLLDGLIVAKRDVPTIVFVRVFIWMKGLEKRNYFGG